MQLIHNAILINENTRFHGYLLISDHGLIAEIGQGPVPKALLSSTHEIIDANRCWLIPGVIDSHVHFREPGGEHKATIASESRAAIAGGVTSYMEMPNTNPPTVTAEALADKFSRAKKDSLANYSFYIGATAANINTLQEIDYTRVPGIKLFMGSSTGGMLVDEHSSLNKIFSLPTLIAVHCEDEATIRQNTRFLRELYSGHEEDIKINWHPVLRDTICCCRSTALAIELARRHSTRLHIMHLTTAQEVEMLKTAPTSVTAEVCVAHLLFCDQDYNQLGTLIKCNPSIKSAMHRTALREALKQGHITTVSTDHAPHTLTEKMQPLLSAPSGMPMVQFSLPAMLDLALRGEWSPELVVKRMCHAQADNFGIERRGYLRPGYAADLVLVNPEAFTTVPDSHTNATSAATRILSTCGWSPLQGTQLRSRVERTWVNGHTLYTHTHGVRDLCGVAMPLRFHK